MARYTDSVCRLCRREGCKLFLKGDRCYTAKCSFVKRPLPPGNAGKGRKNVISAMAINRIFGTISTPHVGSRTSLAFCARIRLKA